MTDSSDAPTQIDGRAPGPRASGGWWRALRILGWAVLGVALLYVAAANAFLNLNVLPLAFAGTEQVKATIDGGWSLLPGRVHVRHARVTFQDHNLQFAIDAERAFVVVHLSELLHHTFHASHLRAEGLSFRMRHRVDPWSQHDLAVGAFAPIPEFRAPAVFEAYVPDPPVSDAAYNLWTIHFDDVVADVKELWVQAFRYQGHGRALGQFELRPARRLWVGPASLELNPGVLSAGGYRVASGLHGTITCAVQPFDVRVPQGMAVFRDISARIRLDASELDPQVYALFSTEPAPQLSSKSGSLHLDAEARHGVLTKESRLELVQRGFQVRTAQFEFDADRIALEAGLAGESSQATLVLDGGTLKDSIALGYPPRVEHLSATLVSDNRDLTQDFQFKEARLAEVRVAGDARWFNRWLKSRGFELSSGSVSAVAHGHYEHALFDGDATLETDGISAKLGGASVRYAGAVALQVVNVDWPHFTGSVNADLTGRALHAELSDGTLNLASLRAHVNGRNDVHGKTLSGRAVLSAFSSSSPTFVVHAPQMNLDLDSEELGDGTQLTHFSALVPTLTAEGQGARLTSAAKARGTLAQPKNKPDQRLSFEAMLLDPEARFGAEPLKIASTPRVQVHGVLDEDARGAVRGTVELLPAAWRLDAANMRFSGESALKLELEALDLVRHQGNIVARLSSTGVTLGDTKQNANCAWSRVQALELDATAKLLARNTTDLSLKAELGQAQLSWGDFTTRADIGLAARFEQGFLSRSGEGTVDLSFRNAAIQSGGGGKTGWAASAPAVEIGAQVQRKDGKLSATAKVSTERVQARIGATHVNTDVLASFKVDALDLLARTAHGSGQVHVRNVSLPQAPEAVSKWWADVQVDSIYGHAEQNLELGGSFRAQLRDATPGLAVLASEGSLPKWIPSAFPLRGLSVTGSVARRCRLTDIHLVNLSGGPAVARGRLQSLPDGFQGALLVRLAGFGAISAGLDFDADHTHFGLFDGDAWLARFDRSFDRKSDDAVKLVCPPDTASQCTDDGSSGSVRASAAP